MSDHHCPTGWHAVPQHWCREKHGCRCDGCTAAYRRHWRSKQHRLHGWSELGLGDGATTRAKINLLCERGWTVADIARAIGCDRHTIGDARRGVQGQLSARVRDGVDRLWRGLLIECDQRRTA